MTQPERWKSYAHQKETTFKRDFPCHKERLLKELLLKERIRSLGEQIFSFKRNSHYEKGRNWRESLLDPVVSPWFG